MIDLLSRFPGLGPRGASRIVFYLLRKPAADLDNFMASLADLKKSVKLCLFCLNPFEPRERGQLCEICSDSKRDRSLICVVEKEADLELLEKTRKYKGLYFILGALLTPLKKRETEKQIVEALLKRIKNPAGFGLTGAKFKEAILAISFTTEGQASSLYLERVLKPLGIKISRLGRGLPVGAEIEYADEETLSSALEGREEV